MNIREMKIRAIFEPLTMKFGPLTASNGLWPRNLGRELGAFAAKFWPLASKLGPAAAKFGPLATMFVLLGLG